MKADFQVNSPILLWWFIRHRTGPNRKERQLDGTMLHTVFYFSSWQGAAGTSVPNFSVGFHYVLLICGGLRTEHRQRPYFCTVTVYPIIGSSYPATAGRGWTQKNSRSRPSRPPHAKRFSLETQLRLTGSVSHAIFTTNRSSLHIV